MKKKVISALLCMTMVATMLAGCDLQEVILLRVTRRRKEKPKISTGRTTREQQST